MFRNGLINASGSLVRLLAGTISVPLLIRHLGLAQYGLWALLTAAINLVMLSEAGLSVSTIVFVARDRARNDRSAAAETLVIVLGIMFVLVTLVLIGMWLGAPVLVSLFPKLTSDQATVAVQALRIGGLVVFLRLLQLVMIGFQQAFEKYMLVNIIQAGQALLLYSGLVLIARANGNLVSMMSWYVVTSLTILTALAMATWFRLRGVTVRVTWNPQKAKAIVRFAFMSGATSIGAKLFSQADRLVVGALLGPGPLGAYAGITTITQKINMLSGTIVQPLLPGLSSNAATHESDYLKIRGQILEAVGLCATVALGLGGVLVVMAPFIIRTAISEQDVSLYSTAFRVATIIYSLYSLNAVGYYILFATRSVKKNLIVVLGSGALSLILIGIGSEVFGLTGAILGNTGYLMTLTLIFLGMREAGISSRAWIKSLALPLGSFLMVALGTFLLSSFLALLGVLTTQLLILTAWFLLTQKSPPSISARVPSVYSEETSERSPYVEL